MWKLFGFWFHGPCIIRRKHVPICLHPQCQDHFPTSHGSYLPWNFHFGGAFLQSNIGSSEFLFANGNFLGNSNSHAMSHGAGRVSPTFHKFLAYLPALFPKAAFTTFTYIRFLKNIYKKKWIKKNECFLNTKNK